jgi:hypothetical protein
MTKSPKEREIGGYFALELPGDSLPDWLRNSIGFRSARDAMLAALMNAHPRSVWAPNYICSAVNDVLAAYGASVKRYTLDANLGVPSDILVGEDEVIIVVDYFGISAPTVNSALDRYGPHRVLVDAAQSLYFTTDRDTTVVYSPRKFLGVPDGGLLVTNSVMPEPDEANEIESIFRSEHLLLRSAGLTSSGYASFQRAEQSLEKLTQESMSRLTRSLLQNANYMGSAKRRIENYRLIQSCLAHRGIMVRDLPESCVPLCCPIPCDEASHMRQRLANQGIFSPCYWPHIDVPADDIVGREMAGSTIFLPCDQRYSEDDMLYMVDTFFNFGQIR